MGKTYGDANRIFLAVCFAVMFGQTLPVIAESGAPVSSQVKGPFAPGHARGQVLSRCMDTAMPGRALAGQPGAPAVMYTSETDAAIRSCMQASGFGPDAETAFGSPVINAPSALKAQPLQAFTPHPAQTGLTPFSNVPDTSANGGVAMSSASGYTAPEREPANGGVFIPSQQTGPSPVYLH